MNRLVWIAIVALAGITSFVVGDLLDPQSVPVAGAVELSGTAPADRPPAEGFFIVPPRVVDFRNDADDSADSSDPSESADTTAGSSADDDDDQDADDVSPDDSSDNSPDDWDDGDDSVDDDD